MPRIKYNERGEEIPDPTKPEVPLGFKRPESLAEQVKRLVRSEQMRMLARQSGHETFDEADDFEVGDDFDPRSPYEEIFDPTANEAPEVEQVVRRAKEASASKSKAPVKKKTPKPQAEESRESEGEPSEE